MTPFRSRLRPSTRHAHTGRRLFASQGVGGGQACRLCELVRGICIDCGASIRSDCGALRFHTSTFHYKSRRTAHAAAERRTKRISETHVRNDYRRAHVLVRQMGSQVNVKRTRRICNELGLQLRNKNAKRRVKAKLQDDRQEAVGPTDVWAMDFVHDQPALSNKLRILMSHTP